MGDSPSSERKYQTFWPRFWAMLLDASPAYPLALLNERLYAAAPSPLLLASWFLCLQLGWLAYSVTLHAIFGQTVGKMITGVAVRDLSKSSLSFRRALLRDGVPLLFTLLGVLEGMPRVLNGQRPFGGPDSSTLWVLLSCASWTWFAIELVTMLTNSRRRALHDLIAGTVVIRVR